MNSDRFKRKLVPWDNDNDEISIKRRCLNNIEQNVSGTKNLANNRLKRLRDTIQADVKSEKKNNFSVSPLPHRELASNASERDISKNSLTDHETFKRLMQKDAHTDKDLVLTKEHNSPITQVSNKNIANDRLKKIKKLLNKSDHGKNSVSNADYNEEDTSNVEKLDCSIKKSNMGISITPLKKNVDINIDSKVCEENICKKSGTNQDKTFIKYIDGNIKKCTENIRSEYNKTVNSYVNDSNQNVNIIPARDNLFNSNATPASQRLLKTDCKNHSPKNIDVKSSPESQKESLNEKKNISSFEIIPHSSSLPSESNSSFSSKMAMTASWVINHHQDVNFNNSLSKSGNSLSVNVDESTARINLDENEDMEWTNAEPDEEVVESCTSDVKTRTEKQKFGKSKDLCIITDTNVFISGLMKIRDIINMKVAGPSQPLIFIPWMVMTELDFMKDSSSDFKLKKSVTSSISFINSMLEQKHPRLIGQTIHEAEKQKYIGKSPDDKIMSCCLQVAEKYEKVILLSNDINLKSKAMIHDISACSSNEIMMKVMSKLSKNNKCKKVIHKMSILCSTIICECAKEAYGDVWMKMDMLSHPPWSLVECLKRFKKYWCAIFSERLLKQFTKATEDLLNLLETNKCITDDSEDFIALMKSCITLCIFLKDIEECRGFCENCIKEITNLT